jgi:hypothetical protein
MSITIDKLPVASWMSYAQKSDIKKAQDLFNTIDMTFNSDENINHGDLDNILSYFVIEPNGSETADVVMTIDNWSDIEEYVWYRLCNNIKNKNFSNKFRNEMVTKTLETAFHSQRYICESGNEIVDFICASILEYKKNDKELKDQVIDLADGYGVMPWLVMLFLEKLNIISYNF